MRLTLCFVLIALLSGVCFGRTIQWTRTSEGQNERLTPQPPITMTSTAPSSQLHLTVNVSDRHQTMRGFGCAVTDSAVNVLHSMPKSLYDKVLQMYFGPDGLGYSFIRVPIGSCDFSLDVWSYDEVKNDVNLQNFTLEHDISTGRIDVIHDIMAQHKLANTSAFKVLGSPWSAPGWMKSNGQMICGINVILSGCHLKDDTSIKAAYAYYFAKWINSFRALGIPVSWVTVQNEPQENVLTYSGMVFTPETERDFVADYLGPILEAHAPNTNILYLDHNKDHLPSWADVILAPDSKARKYLWGAGVHWYTGDYFDNVAEVSAKYPEFGILATEATAVPDWKTAPSGGPWHNAAHYTSDQIGDFNAGVVGWIDWNLMLNSHGGPYHINFLKLNASNSDSMIVYDYKAKELYIQTMYYTMGQMSKYVPEGSVRLGWSLSPASVSNHTVGTVSFITPAHDIVVVIQNENSVDLTVTLEEGGQYAQVTSIANSVSTLVFPAQASTERVPPPPETYFEPAQEVHVNL